MINRIRQVKDAELTPEVLAEREVWRRKHEIDAQIVIAIEKGNPLDLLLTHPAGLIMNRGCCKWLNATPDEMTLPPRQRPGLNQEIAYITQRFADLKSRFDAGQEFVELDQEIATRIQAGARKGNPEVDALAEIKVRCVKGKRGEAGPDIQKFARARGHKDLGEFRFKNRGVEVGWLRVLSDEELSAEFLVDEAAALKQLNDARAQLGMPSVTLVEG